MDLQTFRTEYPEYNDMSDQELAERLHRSLFSDIPKEQFFAVFFGQGQQQMPMGGMQ